MLGFLFCFDPQASHSCVVTCTHAFIVENWDLTLSVSIMFLGQHEMLCMVHVWDVPSRFDAPS